MEDGGYWFDEGLGYWHMYVSKSLAYSKSHILPDFLLFIEFLWQLQSFLMSLINFWAIKLQCY